MPLSMTQRRLLWLSVILSSVGYLAFAIGSGWQDVLAAMRQVGPGPVLVALALSLLNYVLRAERWGLYLREDRHPMPRRRNLQIYFAGFSLTTTPGKAGELIRSLFLRPHGVSYHHSAAMFFSERLADLVAIVALTALGLTHLPHGGLAFLTLVGLLLGGLLLLRTDIPELLLRWQARDHDILHWLADVAGSSRAFWRGGLLWRAQALSAVAWLAEGIGAWIILRTLMPDIDLTYALFAYGFGMLVGALSFLPGGLGGTEATLSGLLVLKGLSLPEAVAATVIIRLATLWFAVLLGLIALLTLSASPSAARTVR